MATLPVDLFNVASVVKTWKEFHGAIMKNNEKEDVTYDFARRLRQAEKKDELSSMIMALDIKDRDEEKLSTLLHENVVALERILL